MSTGKRILIVDDSPLMLDLSREALESEGFEVATAADMAGLEREQERGQFDLILMDVQMPELFGDDIAMVLRDIRGVRTPIYLFSNLDREELAERVTEANLDGFISKRDGIELIVARVKQLLGAGGADRREQSQ